MFALFPLCVSLLVATAAATNLTVRAEPRTVDLGNIDFDAIGTVRNIDPTLEEIHGKNFSLPHPCTA